MAKKKYDFAGWATKANMKCTDGRTIMTGAFKDDDGRRVPLIWNHRHDAPDNVLGHADLEYTDDGVMAYCSFNDSDNAQKAKALVEHGDITSLSIHANELIQDTAKNVSHGVIREVSLVYAPANPGASISQIGLEHADADEGIIYGNHRNDSSAEHYEFCYCNRQNTYVCIDYRSCEIWFPGVRDTD